MNIARTKSNADPRVAQLLSRADVERVKKHFTEAEKLENEAEALVTEEQLTERVKEKFAITKPVKFTVVVCPQKAQQAKLKDFKHQKKVVPDHMLRHKDGEGEHMKKCPVQDRARLVAMLGQLPGIVPFAHVFRGGSQINSNEVAQFGLSAAGAGLMAVEPAVGGVLMMFGALINTMTKENEPVEDEEPVRPEEEEVEETSQSGLFTAKPEKLGWLLSCPDSAEHLK